MHGNTLGKMVSLAMIVALTGLASCASPDAQRLEQIHQAYYQGDFTQTYQEAALLAQTTRGPGTPDAAYMAGLAAFRLGKYADAERYLRMAAQASDPAVAGDALATLGLVYSEQDRFDDAASALTQAAARLEGQDKAQAHLFAGIALQRLGRWPQARTSLLAARGYSSDPGFRSRVDEQLNVVGYTVQIGAFSRESGAQVAANRIAAKAAQLRLGAPAILSAQYPDGRKLYLVQVGRFLTHASAVEARSRLEQTGAMVVPLSHRR